MSADFVGKNAEGCILMLFVLFPGNLVNFVLTFLSDFFYRVRFAYTAEFKKSPGNKLFSWELFEPRLSRPKRGPAGKGVAGPHQLMRLRLRN
jgi:hypothetical protein